MKKAEKYQNHNGFLRQCDDLGRVALPEELLRQMGDAARGPLIIRQTGPRSIQITAPDTPCCLICGGTESLFELLEGYICAGCFLRVNEEFVLGREPDISGLDEEG